MNSIIFHIDVNSAFLSWEAVYRIKHLNGTLDLRDIPSVISGNMESRHGIILAKSVPAKKYGIQTGEPIISAMKKCPTLYTAPPNYELYQRSSQAMMDVLRNYSPVLEQYSIDEAFLDVTSVLHLYESPLALAHLIREDLFQNLGFTVNIGISTNKLLAKMASDFTKPNRVHTLFPDELKEKMWPLPVGDLFYVGKASVKKLHLLGIKTIGQLAQADVQLLQHHLKKHGQVIWNYANGIDKASVIHTPVNNKGYGNSTTISFDVTDDDTAKKVLLALCETVGTRLRKHNVKAEVIAIGIKSFDLQYKSHQLTMATATNNTKELYTNACLLFDQAWDGIPIRHLGVHTSRVKDNLDIEQFHLFDMRQMTLFDTHDYERYQNLDKAIDSIRAKFGKDAIKRATFIDSPIDHLSGGITREKQNVDYSKLNIE